MPDLIGYLELCARYGLVGTLTFEYFYAKRTLNACEAVIECLKVKDE